MRRPFKRSVSPEDTSPAAVLAGVPSTAGVPSWVSHFRRWGVPVSAILVLVLCAPGEQHLADLSGFSYRLSWGMAGLFTLYAGLAAVISTQLPKGARGKSSSIWGAVLSLALAMGAQPVSHLFVTGYLSADPRPPVWLVVTVSSVPPLILGHLLHFAAMPPRPAVPAGDAAGQDIQGTVPVAASRPRRTSPAPRTAPVPPASPAAVPVSRPVVSLTRTGTSSPAAVPSAVPAPVSRPALSAGTSPAAAVPVPVSLGTSRPSMGSRALSLLQAGTPEDTVAKTLMAEYASPDGTPPKTNTVNKSINRAKDKLSRP